MAKFILHGGFTRIDNEFNRGYYREITKDLTSGSNILILLFSRDDSERSDVLEREREKLHDSTTEKKFKILPASENNLIEQIKDCNALVIVGGDTSKLINVLKQHGDFSDAIKDKIVAGSSAGAYVLSTYYHSANAGKISEGLGILPIRVICHFKSDQFTVTDKAIAAMDKYPNDLELVVLKDYEWKVFTQ